MAVEEHTGGGIFRGKRLSRCIVFPLLVAVALVVSASSGTARRHSFSNTTISAEAACLVCHVDGGGLKQEFGENIFPPVTYRSSDGRIHELDAVSKLCISCHDGSTASEHGSAARLRRGSGLGNDHPVGVVYPPRNANGTLRKHYRKLDRRIRLFGPEKNQVSCGTCHDPHENGRRAMLREMPGNRELCLQCHDLD